MVRRLYEKVEENQEVAQALKNIGHWSSNIDRVFIKSKDFRELCYNFAEKGNKADSALKKKLSDIEQRIRSIYKELDAMEETMLDNGSEKK